jgi:23S rRNA (uridine2552-2'-O)-methyltransferase
VGAQGLVIGIDLQSIKPIDGIIFYKGDITEETSLEKIKQSVGLNGAQAVISDMAANISGNYSVDHARSIYLNQQAFYVAEQVLARNGNFVCKIFQGELLPDFINTLKNRFKILKRISPKASRKSSSEIYLIGKSFIRPL